jgi:uncharacterized membrane protein (DUF441 family)
MERWLAWLGVAVLTVGVISPAFATPVDVPEIDPSIAQSALTVLVGGVLVLLGRRRRE